MYNLFAPRGATSSTSTSGDLKNNRVGSLEGKMETRATFMDSHVAMLVDDDTGRPSHLLRGSDQHCGAISRQDLITENKRETETEIPGETGR